MYHESVHRKEQLATRINTIPRDEQPLYVLPRRRDAARDLQTEVDVIGDDEQGVAHSEDDDGRDDDDGDDDDYAERDAADHPHCGGAQLLQQPVPERPLYVVDGVEQHRHVAVPVGAFVRTADQRAFLGEQQQKEIFYNWTCVLFRLSLTWRDAVGVVIPITSPSTK